MTVKLTPALPKADALGLGQALAAAVKKYMMTGRSDAIPVIAVIKIKDVDVQPDDGDTGRPVLVPRIEFQRVEALTLRSVIRTVRNALEQQVIHRRGVATLPAFTDKELIDEAFGDPYIEDDHDGSMTMADRLRAHMIVVHGESGTAGLAVEGPFGAVHTEHSNQHASPPDGMPPHDVTWLGHTRTELRAAEADEDGRDQEVTAEIVDLDEEGVAAEPGGEH